MLAIINEAIGLPEVASEHGAVVDHMLEMLHWFMGLLFVGWTLFFCFCLYRFHHKRNPKASYHGVTGHASSHLEIGVVIVEGVLLLGFAFPMWARQVDEFPNSGDEVKIRAIGKQYEWWFHYPGLDGKFGDVDRGLVSGSNPAGYDKNSLTGKDDFVVLRTMKVPVSKEIIIRVTSNDVIHNLALMSMRVAQDAIPGMNIDMWFVPTKTGEWEMVCGQLCGAGHSMMVSQLEVIPQKDFDKFVETNSKGALAASEAAPAEE